AQFLTSQPYFEDEDSVNEFRIWFHEGESYHHSTLEGGLVYLFKFRTEDWLQFEMLEIVRNGTQTSALCYRPHESGVILFPLEE
ncbi:MAG: hypothetical protein AAF585_08790, partial [Verrucomicrobiota bacterium]